MAVLAEPGNTIDTGAVSARSGSDWEREKPS